MKYMKKSFSSMQPYSSKKIEEGIILNANESPYLPPKEVLDLFQKEIKTMEMNRYPDMENGELCKALAKHYGISSDEVCCGVGSDELLEVAFRAALEPGDSVLSFSPSFSMYKVFADLALAHFEEIYFDEGYTFNVYRMIQAIKEKRPKIVLICTPNNPTGSFLEKEELIQIISSTNALILLDLAYIDFAGTDYTSLALQYPHVIAFRTFSKAMALPSIRVGYAISTKENVDMLNAVKAPYSVTSFSQTMARIAIEHYDLYKENIEKIISERERVYNILKSKVLVYPSKANFLYLHLSREVYEDLLKHKIYIRKMKNEMYRITIGTKEENEQWVKVVMKYA